MPFYPHFRQTHAYSLIEVLFASVIFLISIVGIYGIYSGSLQAMQAADQSAVCSENLLQRMDQIRRTSWGNAVDPVYLSSTNVLGRAITATTQNIPAVVKEYITVSAVRPPYVSPVPNPTPTPSATPASFTITRSGSAVSVSPSPAGNMASQQAVQVKLGITWTDRSNRQHNREFSTVISNAGLAR